MFELVNVIYVHLASNEWGSELMDRIAKETYDKYKPDSAAIPLVIMVHEHAGWFLGYTMIDGRLQSCYSANDAAVYTGSKKQFRDDAYKAQWAHLVSPIRRGEQ